MHEVKVVSVETSRQLNDFVDLPWRLYPPDSLWVPPLKREVRRLLTPGKHPFWEFSRRKLFVAYRDSEPVGRIAGIIDGNHNDYHKEKACAWGFFECRDDKEAARALFSSVEQWGAENGMELVRGPLNPSTNYEIGLLIEGYDDPPTVMMSYNPPYYLPLIEQCGYAKEKDLLALRIVHEDRAQQRIERLAERIKKKRNVWIRPFSRKTFLQDMALTKEIYEAAWKDNWGFVPMTDEEFSVSAKAIKMIAMDELVFFIYYDQEPAGVVVILMDVNPFLKSLNGKIGLTGLFKLPFFKRYVKGLRGVLFGIKEEYRMRGVPLVAFNHLAQVLRGNMRYQYLEFGWNLEDNDAINQLELKSGAQIVKRYRLLRKDL